MLFSLQASGQYFNCNLAYLIPDFFKSPSIFNFVLLNACKEGSYSLILKSLYDLHAPDAAELSTLYFFVSFSTYLLEFLFNLLSFFNLSFHCDYFLFSCLVDFLASAFCAFKFLSEPLSFFCNFFNWASSLVSCRQ